MSSKVVFFLHFFVFLGAVCDVNKSKLKSLKNLHLLNRIKIDLAVITQNFTKKYYYSFKASVFMEVISPVN